MKLHECICGFELLQTKTFTISSFQSNAIAQLYFPELFVRGVVPVRPDVQRNLH